MNRDDIDYLIIFPLKPAFNCEDLTRELFDVTQYINNNQIKFKIGCIKPYCLRNDYIQIMIKSIKDALKSLQKESTRGPLTSFQKGLFIIIILITLIMI